MKRLVLLILLTLLFATPVFATRSLSIISNKTSLSGDEEITITASASGFTAGENIYIKGAFYKDGSTNYFGYTKKGDSFVKNSATATDQLLVSLDSWDNTLISKSDYTDSGFIGNGDYKFKVGFYYTTSGGNLSSVNWSSNNLTVSLAQPIPTQTLTPTSTPVPTDSPANTPTPTNGPIPTPKPTVSPTKKPTPTLTVEPTKEEFQLLGASTSAENIENLSPTPETASKPKTKSTVHPVPIVIITLGIILMLGGSAPLLLKYLKNRKSPPLSL